MHAVNPHKPQWIVVLPTLKVIALFFDLRRYPVSFKASGIASGLTRYLLVSAPEVHCTLIELRLLQPQGLSLAIGTLPTGETPSLHLTA